MTANGSPREAGAAPRLGAAHRPSLREVLGWAATALAVAVAVEVLLWAVLSAVNGRGFASLVAENEPTAAIAGPSLGVVGAVVVRRFPGHALGWVFIAIGQLEGLAVLGGAYSERTPAPPLTGLAAWVGAYFWIFGLALGAGLVAPLFPDGRPASRRWRPLVWVAAAAAVTASVAVALADGPMADLDPPRHNPLAVPGTAEHVVITVATAGLLGALCCGLIGAVALAVRMVRGAGAGRRRIAWFFAAFALVVVAQTVPAGPVVRLVAAGVVPVALGVAMLRHGLFDGDRLLNRTLVYTVLTVLVAGVFGLAVGLAAGALGGAGTGAVLAAVVIALGLAPARDLIQRGVDRMLYGQRRDPYAALTGLGRRLSAAIAPEEVLPIIVRTVAVPLRLPYAAVTLAGEPIPVASHGTPAGDTIDVPLHHTGVQVGLLTVGLRAGQRHLDPGDQRLLEDFARSAGVAANGVRLTHDLRRSRDRLAVTREEERNRIRRDLHDGLGPTLAGVALGIGAARRAVTGPAPDVADLLKKLEAEVRDSLDDVRRLVADLRPGTLTEVGLIGALRRHADTMSVRSDGALLVAVDAPDRLPPVPTDAEIAAYRIALEALTNVARHAHASHCTIELAVTGDRLRLAVRDDGTGIDGTRASDGLGLRSMAERATELGGTCTVTPAPGTGTVVTAVLPLARLP